MLVTLPRFFGKVYMHSGTGKHPPNVRVVERARGVACPRSARGLCRRALRRRAETERRARQEAQDRRREFKISSFTIASRSHSSRNWVQRIKQ